MAFMAMFALGIDLAEGAQLLMFESSTCEWCEQWDAEVGVVYAKTGEARVAPLRRVDIRAPRPADLRAVRGIVYTPTFVLWHDGREVGRIVGYPGEDHFWGLLEVMTEKLVAGGGRTVPARPLTDKDCAKC